VKRNSVCTVTSTSWEIHPVRYPRTETDLPRARRRENADGVACAPLTAVSSTVSTSTASVPSSTCIAFTASSPIDYRQTLKPLRSTSGGYYNISLYNTMPPHVSFIKISHPNWCLWIPNSSCNVQSSVIEISIFNVGHEIKC
jgi:hypothetical protein